MNTIKKLTTAAMALAAALSGAQTANQQPILVVVNGSAIVFRDQQPTKVNNRVLVPLRGIFERLGADVKWDPASQTVTARRGRRSVQLTIGQLDASVNGHDVHLDVPATLIGGSTMVPLRFVSESFGASITWNDQNQEADITPGPDDFVPPPAFDVIAPDTVLPFTINNRLSSYNAHAGDPFTGTLMTYGLPRYLGLPQQTLIYGNVAYAKPRHGNDPGVIELRFDHLVTPQGHYFPVVGRLIGIDNGNVVRGRGGALVARSTVRDDRIMFTGFGAGAGLIVGLGSKHEFRDAALGGLLGAALGQSQRRVQTSDVELVPGTQFGLRLYAPINVPRNIR